MEIQKNVETNSEFPDTLQTVHRYIYAKTFRLGGYPPNEKKIETWAPEPFPDMVETNIRGGGIAVRFPDPLVNQVRWGT